MRSRFNITLCVYCLIWLIRKNLTQNSESTIPGEVPGGWPWSCGGPQRVMEKWGDRGEEGSGIHTRVPWIKRMLCPRNRLLLFVNTLTIVVVSGCGSDLPETASVRGQITYQGQAISEGTIAFYPSKGRSASGGIQSDGTYILTTFSEGDGALLGSHTVTINAFTFPTGAQPSKSMEEEMAQALDPNKKPLSAPHIQWLVPKKYSQRATTPLRKEVASGKNIIDFKLD